MKVKALIPLTLRDSSTGELTSIACGAVVEVSSELGASLISDGLAEVYTLITPSGSVTLTENSETNDVTEYANAVVAVPEPTGSQSITENGTYNIKDKAEVVVNVGTYTVTYNANGGTGSVDAQTVIAGNSINLSDGTGLTPDTGKTFAGWATTSTATEADVTSPYTPTENVTLYAVWADQAEQADQ